MDELQELPTTSETTGPRKLAETLPSVIGQQRGDDGCEGSLNLKAAALATDRLVHAANPFEVNKALRASLEQQHGLQLKHRTPSGGWAMAISHARCPDFDGALQAVELACLPAPKDRILEELVKTRAQCVVKDGDDVDLEIQASVYANRLSDYPADCALYVLRQWPSRSKWWPSWFELEEQLKPMARERTVLLKDLPAIDRKWRADHGIE